MLLLGVFVVFFAFAAARPSASRNFLGPKASNSDFKLEWTGDQKETGLEQPFKDLLKDTDLSKTIAGVFPGGDPFYLAKGFFANDQGETKEGSGEGEVEEIGGSYFGPEGKLGPKTMGMAQTLGDAVARFLGVVVQNLVTPTLNAFTQGRNANVRIF